MSVKDQVLLLSKEEKLMIMEALWEDLSRDDDAFDSPAWHQEVLAEREKSVEDGTVRFLTVDEARAKLKRRKEG